MGFRQTMKPLEAEIETKKYSSDDEAFLMTRLFSKFLDRQTMSFKIPVFSRWTQDKVDEVKAKYTRYVVGLDWRDCSRESILDLV